MDQALNGLVKYNGKTRHGIKSMKAYPMLKMVKNSPGFDNATEHNMASATRPFLLIYIFKNKIHYILLEQVNLALNGSVKYNGKTRHGIKSMMAYPMLKIVKNNLGHCPQRQQMYCIIACLTPL